MSWFFKLLGADSTSIQEVHATAKAARVIAYDAAGAVIAPLTDTQLRATAVPVSGPVTDAQIRATALPVSGPVTDAQMRASAVPTNQTQVGSTNVNAFPAGFQRVTDEPRQVFYDPFDAALDTTHRWSAPVSAGGGVAAAVASGVMTLGSGTTINGYSFQHPLTHYVKGVALRP